MYLYLQGKGLGILNYDLCGKFCTYMGVNGFYIVFYIVFSKSISWSLRTWKRKESIVLKFIKIEKRI